MQTFEEYLRDEVWEAEGVLDDDIAGEFESWLCNVDGEEYITCADEYGKKMFEKGKQELRNALRPELIGLLVAFIHE